MTGTLDVLMPSGERILLAELPATGSIDLVPGEEVDVELSVIPKTDADFIEYQGPAFMALHLVLDPGRPTAITSPEVPMIIPGGWMQLPLLEYQDPIDPEFLTASELRLSSPEAVDLDPGQEATTTARLTVLADAETGTKQFLVRASDADGGATAIRHILVTTHSAGILETTDPNQDVDDADSSARTPGLATPLAALTIALAALLRRRGRPAEVDVR